MMLFIAFQFKIDAALVLSMFLLCPPCSLFHGGRYLTGTQSRRGNLLELIMRTYCLQYEADLDLGCPTRFRLPEPSNMRHAAQVGNLHKR